MRVKVDRDDDFFAESFNEFVGGEGLAESGHVFDGEKMRAEFFKLLGHEYVILQRIFGAGFVEEVAGVANGGLADGAGFENSVDGDAHVFDGIERIEYAEYV